MVRNISAATVEVEHIGGEDPTQLVPLVSATRQLAILWEALAKLREGTSAETALLNAAITYELADYQASAACIGKRLQELYDPTTAPLIIEMATLFLQRRFVDLLRICRRVQREPRSTDFTSLEYIEAMATALAGQGFGHAARFLLSGEPGRLSRAHDMFLRAQMLFGQLGYADLHNLLSACSSLLPVIEQRAIWSVLPPYTPQNARWTRCPKLLARGLGQQLAHARSVSELRPSQLQALDAGLLSSTTSKIIRMPTSAGKTRVAELAIVHTLVLQPGAKCLYVAPFRALAAELEQSFFSLLSDLGYRVSAITGAFERDDFDVFQFQEAEVLVKSEGDTVGKF